MASICRITMYDRDNYVVYSDTDATVDYFNAYSLGVKQTEEWLTRDAGDVIEIRVANHSNEPKYHRRVQRYARAIGYDVEVRTCETSWGVEAPIWTLRRPHNVIPLRR